MKEKSFNTNGYYEGSVAISFFEVYDEVSNVLHSALCYNLCICKCSNSTTPDVAAYVSAFKLARITIAADVSVCPLY
jgi:hypothetical protein